jgi:hypothetical protein
MGGVLHVVPQLSGGGGGRATLSAARAAAQETEMPQAIASLRAAAPGLAKEARREGVELIDSPTPGDAHEAMRAADLVQVSFWNSPELIELLESDLPPCRLLVWPQVVGNTAPQVIDPVLLDRATLSIGSSRRNAEVIGGEPQPEVIPPVPGWDRVEGVTRTSTAGFNVGYVGSVGVIRLHPDFVRISDAARIPEARFIVCGVGDASRSLPRQAEEIGARERFDFRGHVPRIREALSEFDVFGYPIRPGTSASSDLNLKEAMYAGVPPVVLADGATEELVDHALTGLVAPTPADYPRALERLHADPDERSRLSANASSYATEHWSPSRVGRMWAECHERALSLPKRSGPALDPVDPDLSPGVSRFLRGLGDGGGDFELSLRGSAEEREAAERRIQSSPVVIAYQDGGLLDYRRRHPGDPTLALWTALALRGAGQPALAAAELHRARQLGAAA